MNQTVFVTGATGLAGANVCKSPIERGDTVRALARKGADTQPLIDMGVHVVAGDITDADDVLHAATGSDAAIHCAAVLGGASQDLELFRAVNVDGTGTSSMPLRLRHAARGGGETGPFFDTTGGLEREDAPVSKAPSDDPYTITKMAAFEDAMALGGSRSGCCQHPPGSHLRPLPGGEQRAREYQLQPGAPFGSASEDVGLPQVSRQLGLRR